ncbi:TB10A protein, partial [Chloroceryle aenea]|nr:TB10A protein [Chloroceryle aenea]
QQDLFRVLKAYTLYRPEEGYCQAQAPIAAVLLMHMPAEVRACGRVGRETSGREQREAIQLDGQILFSLLHKVSPVAYKHLSKQKIDPILYMTEWFMCAFSRTLPWSSVLRVWDMFFCEGVKIIFRVGLVLLKHTLGSSDNPKIMQETFLVQEVRCWVALASQMLPSYPGCWTGQPWELPPSEFMQVADSTWLVLSVVSNGREPSGSQATGVTKIARSVIAPLAEHHVSVLMLSTYQPDSILEESGECVPVTCDDVSNGFLKPKPAASPTLHPVQSPQTRFCVLTVAPDTLPAIATMLIDVLFYSHRW